MANAMWEIAIWAPLGIAIAGVIWVILYYRKDR